MRRRLLTLSGLATGVVLTLVLHLASGPLALPGGLTPLVRSSTPSSTAPSTTTVPPASGPPASPTTTVPTTTIPVSTTPRSATGPLVNYSFGQLAVKVTVAGTKITAATVVNLNDGGNPRSQYIDSASIPQLESQVLSVQSANIQGVSGASWTSAGFAKSLQGALTQLGV